MSPLEVLADLCEAKLLIEQSRQSNLLDDCVVVH